jgi:hypothetical protein
MRRTHQNHSVSCSDGKHTNMAESFLSPLRRMSQAASHCLAHVLIPARQPRRMAGGSPWPVERHQRFRHPRRCPQSSNVACLGGVLAAECLTQSGGDTRLMRGFEFWPPYHFRSRGRSRLLQNLERLKSCDRLCWRLRSASWQLPPSFEPTVVCYPGLGIGSPRHQRKLTFRYKTIAADFCSFDQTPDQSVIHMRLASQR